MVKTSIGLEERGTGKSMMDALPLAESAAEGGKVLMVAAAVDAGLVAGRMLTPYWLWEDLRLLPFLPARVRGVFYDVVNEKLMQRFTWGSLRSHRTSDESYDTALQTKLWKWSEEKVADEN
jgi:hypothetical protein